MAKALRTAAFVVGAVALVATGVGAAAGVGLLGATTLAAGASAATVGTLATVASVASIAQVGAAALSIASAIAQPKGSLGGNPTEFTIDKESGIPYAIGRTYSAGKVVHRQYYGSKNSLESWVAVHSLGPIKSLGAFQVSKATVPFQNGAAVGTYAGYMWLDQQLGACPEARALQGPQGSFPGWGPASKLSGLAADLWTLKFDTKGKKYPNGVPEHGRILEGVLVYDARLDSTYPGGSGPCRLGQEATYVYSECPANHALTWAYGRLQNGTLVAGGGVKVSGIDLAPFIEWANVCDANGWKAGGIVYTSADNDWDILKMICQAGGAEPMPVGGQLSVTFNAPRVSIGTITSDDIIGDVDVPGTASRRARRNTVIPKVRLESHGWQVVPLNAIAIPDYVAVDGGSRPREIEFPLVQQVDQGAQLGLYEILNGRELEGILLPCKATMIGYRPGDCLTVDIPEAALVGRDVVVRTREIDMGTVGVTFTCRSETASKHSFALGKGGMAPPTPDLSIPTVDLSAPDAADWTANGAVLSANGVSFPAVIVTGATDDRPMAGVLFEYRPYVAGADPEAGWSGGGIDGPGITRKEITSVRSDTQYEVAARYMVAGTYSDRLVLGPVTAGVFSAAGGTQAAIATSFPIGLAIAAADSGVVTISAHTRRYTDGHPDVAVNGATIETGLAPGAFRAIGYDDEDRTGGAVAYQLFEDDIDARAAPDQPGRHYLGYAIIPTAGSPPSSGGGATPPGGQYNKMNQPEQPSQV
jgi:hypothetical protein